MTGMTDPRSALPAILAALPGTCAQLSARTGAERTTPLRWMKELRGIEVYISGWTTGRNPAAIWSRGNLPDVPYVKMTKAETSQRYRDKLKKSGESDFLQAKRRASYHATQRAKQAPRSWLASLGL